MSKSFTAPLASFSSLSPYLATSAIVLPRDCACHRLSTRCRRPAPCSFPTPRTSAVFQFKRSVCSLVYFAAPVYGSGGTQPHPVEFQV